MTLACDLHCLFRTRVSRFLNINFHSQFGQYARYYYSKTESSHTTTIYTISIGKEGEVVGRGGKGDGRAGRRGGEERRKGWRGKGALQANFCLLFIFYKANLVPHQYSSGFKSKFLC